MNKIIDTNTKKPLNVITNRKAKTPNMSPMNKIQFGKFSTI